MRPIIGVLAEIDAELNARVQNTYIHAIEVCGGSPILLPRVNGDEAIAHLIDICDGVFFTGGADIAPRRYGEEASKMLGPLQEERDEFEFNVFGKVIETEKPILAICRGAQLVNVALGGTLYQDIPSEIQTKILHRQSEPKLSPSHSVRIIPDTPLYGMTGAEKMRANSFHHQAIKALGTGLKVMATAEDGIIEAVYAIGERYIRAYQWHPERLVDTDIQNRMLFEDFIRACEL